MMNYDFQYEIELLNKSVVNDKLEIFSVYSDFYKDISVALMFDDRFDVSLYNKYLTELFETILKRMNLESNNGNFIKFFNCFFGVIIDSKLTNNILNSSVMSTIDSYISKLKVDNNYTVPYVDVLDTINMDFNTKAKVLMIIKEHFDKFSYNVSALYYTKNEILSYLDKEIVEKVVSLIPEIVSRSDGFESFENNLQKETYNYVTRIINSEDESFTTFTDRKFNEYYHKLDNSKKEIFWSVIYTCLSGYNKDDNAMNDKSIFEEIKYNMSVASLNNLLQRMCFKNLDKIRRR